MGAGRAAAWVADGSVLATVLATGATVLATGADVGAGGAVDGAGTAGGSVLAALGSTESPDRRARRSGRNRPSCGPAPVVLVGEPAEEPEPGEAELAGDVAELIAEATGETAEPTAEVTGDVAEPTAEPTTERDRRGGRADRRGGR